MKMTLNFSQFIDNWPESRKDQFSHDALKAIFEEIESIEEDTNIETEFDPVAICCGWSEYDNAMEAAKEYGYEEVVDLEPYGNVDLLEVAELEETQARDWLENRTTVRDAGKKIVMIQF